MTRVASRFSDPSRFVVAESSFANSADLRGRRPSPELSHSPNMSVCVSDVSQVGVVSGHLKGCS